MPSPAFVQLFERAFSDEAFAARLQEDHVTVLEEFALTSEEKEALLSLDEAKVAALGVDERISKSFSGATRPF